MKQATISITFDEEKLGAIKKYMSKKDSELQTELSDFMQKLYEKYVPLPVREYIEEKEANSKVPKPANQPKISSAGSSGRSSAL